MSITAFTDGSNQSERRRKMTEANKCGTKGHDAHMCQLKAGGCTAEIERFSANPRVKCGACGAAADMAEHVCKPVPI
jgi:hypothetical protein